MSGGIRIRPGLRKPNNPSQFRFRVRAFLLIEHVIWKFVLNGDHLPEHQQAVHSDSTFACFTIFSPANGLVVRKTGRCIAVARGFSMKRTVRPSSVTSRTDESVSSFALTYWRLCSGCQLFSCQALRRAAIRRAVPVTVPGISQSRFNG